jgi:hypothetical protein
MAEKEGSVILGAIWMIVISILLCWLPVIGSLIAGIVGGKTAGGVGSALLAAFLPGVFLGLALFFLGTSLTALPVVGMIFGMGGFVVSLVGIGPLLLGAIIGGILA